MNTQSKPRALRPGDTIGIVATASPFDRADFMRGVAALEMAGYRVVYRDDIFDTCAYHAGSIARRCDELHSYLRDDSITAICCARGGYGSQKLLPHLDLSNCSPKIVVGYSDVTALQSFLHRQHGWPSFYGPTVCRHLSPPAPASNLECLLQAVSSTEPLGALPMGNARIIKAGKAQGPLLGGCLTLIQTSVGTPYQYDTAGSILFLEDRGEKIYVLDRMLVHLRQAGVFKQVQGVVFGSLELPDSEAHPDWLDDMLREHFKDFAGPVIAGYPAGHCDPFVTLPLGCQATLSTDPLQLSITEAAVHE